MEHSKIPNSKYGRVGPEVMQWIECCFQDSAPIRVLEDAGKRAPSSGRSRCVVALWLGSRGPDAGVDEHLGLQALA